ncbi:penicillin acylase family protein [Candidatus Solirubrobacter pratensis]|uniref:penicillin acylase family protein n=1 Tax=Candidatus Solirubrobacter pratensis TaxID=1298857 RepID=UPI0018C97A01|nr:penicillin acylase family protein [Candidatus Solirubrobacter pratensis]
MAFPASAAATDYAATARNIVPSGQLGGFPVPPDAGLQAQMYDALTPKFNQVTDADLQTDFKSEGFGVGPDGPGTPEAVPRKGVTIVRDRFHVPHITGATHDDVTWAMGWITQEDRALLLAQARYPGRLAALDAPNIDAFSLVEKLATFTPTKQADGMIERTAVRNLRSRGQAGRTVLHDIDVYVQGLNARLRAEKSGQKPWTRVDVIGANALVGQGGGDEARRSEFLSTLRNRLGAAKAGKVFGDLTEFDDPDSPVTIEKSFPSASSTRGRRPRSWTPSARRSSAPRWAARSSRACSTPCARSSAPTRVPAATSPTAASGTWTRTCAGSPAPGSSGRSPRATAAAAAPRRAPRPYGARSRRPARRSRRPRAPRTRTPGAPMPTRSAWASFPAC